jgi:asparagine synthase (glutamine-hydrolysing)
MCGIAGLMYKSSKKPPKESLQKLAQALHHRGPDDHGILIKDSTALVHTRLSIIDLEGGHQPLVDDQGLFLIVNGEIYNHLELKRELKDYPFKTASDCEPILPLYRRYGLDFVKHLRGMYGLALYDSKEKSLILARDSFGIKPLYYIETPEFFAFSSEPQAFFASHLIEPRVDPSVRSEVLQLRYTALEKTIFVNVYRLLPGELMVVKEGRVVEKKRQQALSQVDTKKVNEKEALKNFEQALEESVNVHLRSDVPYGLFLSGGLDSASILSMMKRHSTTPILTYTVGFSGTKVHDEREQAKLLATHFKTQHQEINFGKEDFWSLLPLVAASVDDLQIDMASLPTFKLAEIAKRDVKVVLCGEGGDEMLAGYGRYRKTKFPKWLGGRITREKGSFDKAGYGRYIGDSWKKQLTMIEQQETLSHRSKMQIAQAVDCATWLANGLLIKLDRCLMANSLEGRTPFLDSVVERHTYGLSDKLKVSKGQGKWILRKWLSQNVPEAQPFAKKRGFTVPVGEWIFEKSDRLFPLVARQEGIQEVFPLEVVKTIFLSRDKHSQFVAWTLLFYAVWHQIHVLRKPVERDVFSMLA